jgi:O-antigen/teichoic acid export membrane protein
MNRIIGLRHVTFESKIIHSGFWSLGSNWALRGLGLVKTVIIAHLLAPEDFGLIGLALFSINALNVCSEAGFEATLIQRRELDRRALDTVWTISILRGLALFLLTIASAEWIAAYFDSPGLAPVLQVMAVSLLLSGFNNTGLVFFQRDLEFKKKAILEMVSEFGGAVVTLALAVWCRNVWALAIGSVALAALQCLGSYHFHPYRPRICADWRAAAELMGFGKHIFMIGLLAFIITNFDDALVGKMLGLEMLGFYAMAFNIASIPVASLVGVLSRVFFPAYARLQQEPALVGDAFRRTIEGGLLILLPLTGLMIALAPGFTIVFLGEKWTPMIPALQALCFFGLFRGLSSLFYPLHLGVNRPDIQVKIKAVDLLSFLVLVYPCTLAWGISGTGWSMAAVYLINLALNIVFTRRILSIPLRSLAGSVLFPAIVALLVYAVSVLLQTLNIPGGELIQMLLIASAGSAIVMGLFAVCRKQLLNDVVSAVKASTR